MFTNLKGAHPFDDVMAKVLFKEENTQYAFAMQVKHIGKGVTLDVEKYLKGYNKIFNMRGFESVENIVVDNIHFCYFCIENVRTKEDYRIHVYNRTNE